jgi:hypothetical protein
MHATELLQTNHVDITMLSQDLIMQSRFQNTHTFEQEISATPDECTRREKCVPAFLQANHVDITLLGGDPIMQRHFLRHRPIVKIGIADIPRASKDRLLEMNPTMTTRNLKNIKIPDKAMFVAKKPKGSQRVRVRVRTSVCVWEREREREREREEKDERYLHNKKR